MWQEQERARIERTQVAKARTQRGLPAKEKGLVRDPSPALGRILELATTVERLLEGYDHHGQGRSVQGRLVNVHRTLVSGAAVAEKNMVVLGGDWQYRPQGQQDRQRVEQAPRNYVEKEMP